MTELKKYSEKKLKKLRRAFVERNLKKAKSSPLLCGLKMKGKGWYSDIPDSQLEHHVINIVQRVKEEGIKYANKLEAIESTPEIVQRRKSRKPKERPGFFDTKVVSYSQNNKPWTPEETDKLLNRALPGKSLTELARLHNRNPKSIRRHWDEILYNERGKGASDYKPVRRIWRGGMRITPMEQKIIDRHLRDGVPLEITARILQRKPKEIRPDYEGEYKLKRLKDVALTADIVQALRYLYHCSGISVVSDQAYDDAKAEEIEYGGAGDILLQPASKRVVDYPAHIRSLAYYMHFKFMEKTGQWKTDQLPPHFFNENGQDRTGGKIK